MSDLYISREELYNLDIAFPNIETAESILYKYFDGQVDYILKIFNTCNPYDLLRLLARLKFWQSKDFNYLINPEFMVYLDGFFNGFATRRFNGMNIHSYLSKSTLEEQFRIFNILSVTLKEAHEDGVIIGDLSHNNILTNGQIVKFCDVNSMGYIDKIKPLLLPEMLAYNDNILEDNKGTIESDVFLLNMMVMEYLFNTPYELCLLPLEEYLKYINEMDLPNEVKDVFIHLYDIFNGYPCVYPHEYLSILYDYKRTRKRF